MKVYLVTSQVTYIPENYYDLFAGLMRTHHYDIAGLIILKNLDLSLFKQILGLPLLGAPKLCLQLLKNVSELPFDPRVKLFKEHQKEVHYLKTVNDEPAHQLWQSIRPDLLINARTRCIYKKKTLKAPSLGCVNIHHGLLPKYRGTLCDLYALSEGREAGFSIHKMNPKIDDGEIYEVHPVVEAKTDQKDYLSYLKQSAIAEAKALGNFLDKIKTLQQLPQGQENICSDIVMSTTPTKKMIGQFKKKGMIL